MAEKPPSKETKIQGDITESLQDVDHHEDLPSIDEQESAENLLMKAKGYNELLEKYGLNNAIKEGSLPFYEIIEKLRQKRVDYKNTNTLATNIEEILQVKPEIMLPIMGKGLLESFEHTHYFTEDDLQAYFNKEIPLDLLSSHYHGLSLKFLIEFPESFLDDDRLKRWHKSNISKIKYFYWLKSEEYISFIRWILEAIELQNSGQELTEDIISVLESQMSELVPLVENFELFSYFFIKTELGGLIHSIALYTNEHKERLEASAELDDITLIEAVSQPRSIHENSHPVPTELKAILSNELVELGAELENNYHRILKEHLEYIGKISNNSIKVGDEKILIESLQPEILQFHLNTFEEYHLLDEITQKAMIKLNGISKSRNVINWLINLNNDINEINYYIDVIEQSEDKINDESIKNHIAQAKFGISKYDEYINQLSEGLNEPENISTLLCDIETAHQEEIHKIQQLLPTDKIKQIALQETSEIEFEPVEAEKEVKLITGSLRKQDELILHDEQESITKSENTADISLSKSSRYYDASSEDIEAFFNEEEILVETTEKTQPTISLNEEVANKLKAQFNEFFETIQTFVNLVRTHNWQNPELKLAANTLVRVYEMRTKGIEIDSIMEKLSNSSETLTLQEVELYLSFINQNSVFGNRTCFRILYLLENHDQLIFPISLGNLRAINACLKSIGHEGLTESFVQQGNELSQSISRIAHIKKINENLKVIQEGTFLDNCIGLIESLSNEDNIEILNACYYQLINELNTELSSLEDNMQLTQSEIDEIKEDINVQLESFLSLKKFFHSQRLKLYLEKVNHNLFQYQKLCAKLCKARIHYGHTFNRDKLLKTLQMAKKCNNMFDLIQAKYTSLFKFIEKIGQFSIISPDMMVLLVPFKNQSFMKDIENTNKLLTYTFSQATESIHIFKQQFCRGQFFINESSTSHYDILEALSLGMHTHFNPHEILDMCFTAYDNVGKPNEKFNLLQLIKFVLKHDTYNKLINYKGDDNKLTLSILSFLEKFNEPELIGLKNEIEYLIIEKRKKKEAKFFTLANGLSLMNENPPSEERLSQKIYDLIIRLKNPDEMDLELVTHEFKDIISAADSKYFQREDESPLSPDFAANMFVDLAFELGVLDDETSEMVLNKKYQASNANFNPSSGIPDIAPLDNFSEILEQFETIAKGEILDEKKNSLQTHLASTLEDAFRFEISSVEPIGLISSVLKVDQEHIKNQLYCTPASLHTNRCENLIFKLQLLFSLLIFNKMDGNQIIPRLKYYECLNVVNFYYELVEISLAKHDYYTADILSSVLNSPPVSRLIKDQKDTEKLRNLFQKQKTSLQALIKKFNALPHIELSKSLIETYLQTGTEDYFSKFAYIGKEALRYREYSLSIIEQQDKNLDSWLYDFANSFLTSFTGLNFYDPFCFDYAFDPEDLDVKMLRQSEMMHPDVKTDPKDLDSFDSIDSMMEHLKSSSNRGWGYHVTAEKPKSDILKHIKRQILKDYDQNNKIPDFNLTLSVLDVIKELEDPTHVT